MDNFITIRSFNSIDDAKNYQDWLAAADIQLLLKDIPPGLDMTFLGSTAGHTYEIQVLQSDTELAESIISKHEETKIDNTENEHYLYGFTNVELFEILEHPDEWNKLDYDLAKEILVDRGETVDKETLIAMRNDRLLKLSKPEESKSYIIIAGYILSLLGGIVGVAIGYSLWTTKKSLPNGESVWAYVEKDRKHGRNMFTIGVIVLGLALLLRIFGNF